MNPISDLLRTCFVVAQSTFSPSTSSISWAQQTLATVKKKKKKEISVLLKVQTRDAGGQNKHADGSTRNHSTNTNLKQKKIICMLVKSVSGKTT